jgi:hypothetical protein
MTDFILLLLFGVCWTWGFRAPFQEGYFLEKVGNLFRTETDDSPSLFVGNWFTKPIFDCPPCMASFHGFCIAFAYFTDTNLTYAISNCHHSFVAYFFLKVFAYMICLCGINYILKSIIYPEYE